MNLALVIGPQSEPVAIAEAKLHARITITSEDSMIQELIIAARQFAESFTRRRLITQTWDGLLDCFPAWGIEMPHAPLISVTSIQYIDTAGGLQTLNPTTYVVDVKSSPGRITPAFGQTWPPTRTELNAVTIRFVCGYGNASAVPDSIKNAMKLHIQAHYDRGEQMEALVDAAERLLAPYRLIRF